MYVQLNRVSASGTAPSKVFKSKSVPTALKNFIRFNALQHIQYHDNPRSQIRETNYTIDICRYDSRNVITFSNLDLINNESLFDSICELIMY